MASAIISGWQELPGLGNAVNAAGFRWWIDGGTGAAMTEAEALAAVNAIVAAYAGSAGQLAFLKAQKQAALDALLDNNFDLKAFIRGGSATAVTAAGVGAFLATITNNYRTLRASIAAAADAATLTALNIQAGWPNNP